MSQIIDINDYKITKQKEFFVNLYDFLNKNMDYSLDIILEQLNDDLTTFCTKYKINSICIDSFEVPNITFIAIKVVSNSDIKNFLPENLNMKNINNKYMFKNTLLKVIKTYTLDYSKFENMEMLKLDMEEIINKNFKKILKIVPDKIILV